MAWKVWGVCVSGSGGAVGLGAMTNLRLGQGGLGNGLGQRGEGEIGGEVEGSTLEVEASAVGPGEIRGAVGGKHRPGGRGEGRDGGGEK